MLKHQAFKADHVLAADLRVGVRAPLTTVDHVEVLERESKFGSKIVDPGSKIALGQSLELVEQWLDYNI